MKKTLLCLCLSLAALPPSGLAADKPSLIINGKPISDEIFFAYRAEQIQRDPNLARGLTETQQVQLLNQLLNMTLLSQEAEKQGLDKQPLVVAALDVARMNTLAEAMIGKYLDKHPVTEKEIQQAYQDSYLGNPATEYRVRHILAKDQETARKAIAELKAGKPFPEVAKRYSNDPSAAQGGDLGWLDSEALAGPVGDAVKQLKKGEYSQQPVKSDFGWHVFLLEDTRQLPPPKLTEVRDSIVTKLKKKRLGEWIRTLRKQAKIETPRHRRSESKAAGPGKAPDAAQSTESGESSE